MLAETERAAMPPVARASVMVARPVTPVAVKPPAAVEVGKTPEKPLLEENWCHPLPWGRS